MTYEKEKRVITYLDIYNRLKGVKSKNTVEEEEYEILVCTNFVVPSFIIPPYSTAKGAKTKWINNWRKILTFIENIQYRLPEGRRPSLPISTRDEKNLAIWGSPRSVTAAIKRMVGIGLLRIETADARFERADTRSCYTYYYYRENEEKFIQFCKDNHIEPFVIKDSESKKVKKPYLISDFDKSKVMIGTCSELKKPDGISDERFKEFLTECLYEKYPQIKYYKKLVDEMNKVYYKDYPQFSIKFIPTFTWKITKKGVIKKSVTKIGLRAACSWNNKEKKEREAILEEYGFNMRKDIRSSVPRLTKSLSSGEWYSEDIDLYKEIYKYCGDDELTDEMREAIKYLFMRPYFDGSPKEMVNHVWRKMNREGVLKQDVRRQMRRLRAGIEKACGGRIYGSYIFLVESCVYLRVMQRLLAQGRNGWLLFDAFYCTGLEGEDDKQFNETVEHYLKESFEEYMTFHRVISVR